MIRGKIKDIAKQQNGKYEFRLRGLDNTRIEALSDGVFAIAIALLLISASVPEKFDELMEFIKDFVPFTITIVLLSLIWYQHYLFFVRYGLKDVKTVALNTFLLILILYYVYPLKFLFKTLYLLFTGIFTNDQVLLEYLFKEVILIEDTPDLMIIYGMGLMGIFLTLALLYYSALKKKESLQLDQIEVFDTKSSIIQNLLMGLIPLLSTLVAILEIGGPHNFTIAGFTYWSYIIVMPWMGIARKKKRMKLIAKLDDAPPENL